MLVFSTRFPLNDSVGVKECSSLFSDWITGSQHYNISAEELKYDADYPYCFSCRKDNISIEMLHYNDNQQFEFLACRLTNTEEDSLWVNDCIFMNDNGKKSLLVQLECNNLKYNIKLKSPHKPHIIKMCLENGYCGLDSGIPVADTPLKAEEYFNECSNIMAGNCNNSMPVVYISFDLFNKPVIDPKKLAKRLSGVAHVFIEQSKDTSLSLRECTSERNVHNGYIGIYYPKSEIHKTFNPEHYYDYMELKKDIIQTVQQSLINRSDAVLFSWDQIINLQARQKMLKWKEISETNKNDLSQFLELSDKELSDKNKMIDDLNRQIYCLQSQLDSQREQNLSVKSEVVPLLVGEENGLYKDEIKLLLISILSQVKDNYPKNSRAYAIIQSLLQVNPHNNACEKIVKTVRQVFSKGEKLGKQSIKLLEDVGFKFISDNSHKKMVFYDNRYTFTLYNTPSDFREGKNMASDIIKIIDVEKKI